MTQKWRLICPDCERRRFHDKAVEGGLSTTPVSCRVCGNTDTLEERIRHSRIQDPNPDRNRKTTLRRWQD